MVVLYVDDVGIAYTHESDVDKLLDGLQKHGLEFTKEGTFTDFLGIKFVKNATNNTVTLTQKGLIQRIIEATGMVDCNPNWTPAIQLTLGMIDPNGELYNETWSYPSIVGMLLYLSTNARPDIAFAVSQVARFNHSPRKVTQPPSRLSSDTCIALLTKEPLSVPPAIFQLIATWTQILLAFMVVTQTTNPQAPSQEQVTSSLLVNAPFFGNRRSKQKSHSEYSALSASMRTLLPLRSLLTEVVATLRLPPQFKSTIRCRVFEDNNGALLLATKQRITNRTKYFLVKWHFFWSHVTNGDVTILKVDTKEQWANYLTKGLNRETFEAIRKLVQGW